MNILNGLSCKMLAGLNLLMAFIFSLLRQWIKYCKQVSKNVRIYKE